MGFRHRAMKAEDVLVLSRASVMNVEGELCVWTGTRRSGRGYKSDVRGRAFPVQGLGLDPSSVEPTIKSTAWLKSPELFK